MEEKTAITTGKHDVTGAGVVKGATCNLDHFARPEIGQHTLAADLKAQAAGIVETLRRQRGKVSLAIGKRSIYRTIRSQDVLRAELHAGLVPAILPQDRAAVSNTRS
jgi:hypothetical protein